MISLIAGAMLTLATQYPSGMPTDVYGKYMEMKDANLTKEVYAGNYELTAYVATGNPCADGDMPCVGYTVASNDPNLWHKYIEVEGYGTYYVHDRGGMASNVLDIFVGSYDEAIQFGRRKANVYILDY